MSFLRISPAILFAGILLLQGCQADEAASPQSSDALMNGFTYSGDFKGPLGLQLWSVREQAADDLEGTLTLVRDLGFQEVETAGTYGLTAAEFRRMLDSLGLKATAGHFPYDLLRDSIEVVLNDAEALGLEYLGVAWIPHPEDRPFDFEMARQAAADFNRMGEAAASRGMKFFYHVHGYEFQPDNSGRTPFDVIVAETNAENVKFEMDVFWTVLPGVDPTGLLRKYPDRWELMHVKDLASDWELGDQSGHAPVEANVAVGSGQIDYKAVLQAAAEIGLDRYYIEDESTAPLENIPISIDYLETLTF